MKRPSTSSERTRLRVAEAAGKLLATGEQPDADRARRKAAQQLGLGRHEELPSAAQVHEAAQAYRRLFASVDDGARLHRQREAALEAMRFFAAFDPRLVGEVLRGDAGARAAICLHLHAEHPDDVATFLLDQGIRAERGQRPLRLARDRREPLPAWHFEAGGQPFDLLVLPRSALRQAPLDDVDDVPMARAGAAALAQVLVDLALPQRRSSAT